MPRLARLTVMLAVAWLWLTARPALAHGFIVRAIPENRAVLERSPARLQYWFSETLEPEFSSLTVRDQFGEIVASGGVTADDEALMTARLPSPLADGAYIVELRAAFASDGHVAGENLAFFVGEPAGEVTDEVTRNVAAPLEVLWRTLTIGGSLVLFGAFALYNLVLLPAWGNPAHRAGLLPPRVMAHLNWTVVAALAIVFAANLLALLQQSTVFFNASALQVIEQGLWQVVRIGSRFGDVWTARMGLLGLVAFSHSMSLYLREEQPETVRSFWAANVWLTALLLGTFSAASHAAGSLVWPWLAIAVDWLHLLAVGIWAGGLAALVLVLPSALRPYEGEARRLALLAVLSRFSRLAVVAVFLVVSTGIFSALNYLNAPSDLGATSYGGALVLKTVLVGVLVLMGLIHYITLHPQRYRRMADFLSRVGTLTRTLRLEVLLALAVLVAASLLSATPVPIPEQTQRGVPPLSAVQTVDAITANLTVSPGGPGVNSYDVLITRASQPVDGLLVRLQMVNPQMDKRGSWQTIDGVGDGLYIAAGNDVNHAGRWIALLDVTGSAGDRQRFAYELPIREEAAVSQMRTPHLLNWLALASVVLAVGWAMYPLVARFYARLHLTPITVTIVVVAVLLTVVVIGAAYVGIQNTQAQVEARLNPTPQMVNPVPPDAASLERGRVLFEQHCPWETHPTELDTLKERLPRTRDEELYVFTREGWQGLPPCEERLTDQERWDIVNYFRTFEG